MPQNAHHAIAAPPHQRRNASLVPTGSARQRQGTPIDGDLIDAAGTLNEHRSLVRARRGLPACLPGLARRSAAMRACATPAGESRSVTGAGSHPPRPGRWRRGAGVMSSRLPRGTARPGCRRDGSPPPGSLLFGPSADGQPASVPAAAAAAGIPESAAGPVLRSWPAVFWDDQGRVTGFWGLALAEMPPHRIRHAGTDLSAWCAFDPLFHPRPPRAPAGRSRGGSGRPAAPTSAARPAAGRRGSRSRGWVTSAMALPIRWRSPTQTSSGSLSTMKFSPDCPQVKSSRPSCSCQ
jgi:hypothetical protein